MNKQERPHSAQSNLLITLMAILTFMVCLGMPEQASGQWTTNGNNINNTNTGNVGIGTSAPNAKLVVLGGNIGLGSNDMETWTSSSAVIESLNTSVFFGLIGDIHMVSNAYHNNGWKYKGSGPASNFYLYNGAAAWRVAPSGTADAAITWYDAMTLSNAGNLGIGTTAPTHKLHIAGDNTAAGGYPLIKLQNTQTGGHSYWLYSGANGVAGDFALFDETDYAFRFYVKGTSGNIGIGGTATPAFKLDVQNGQVNASGGLCIAGDCKTAWSQVGGGSTSQWTTSGSNIYYNSGNVAIGTPTAGYRLDVQSTSNIIARFSSSAAMNNQVLFDAPAGWNSNITLQQAGASQWYLGNRASNNRFSLIEATGSIEVFSILQNGNVGIGTITPAGKVEVNGTVYSSAAPTNTTFSGAVGATNANFVGSSGYWALRTATNNSYNLDVYNGGSPTTAMTASQAGNVGIGTTAPAAKLDVNGNANVNGNITVTGNINAKYQDVAEWVPSRQKLSAGTVVVLDSEQSNHVLASSSAYDTRVAGVVSDQPGVILGEAGENKALIATTGRVKIKVDATRAPIRIGDLLVTSDKEGYAMKSEPISVGGRQLHAPGTLLGKALEPLEKGTGQILVLLSLQ